MAGPNVMAAFKAMFEEAERLIRTGGDSHKADDLCFRLLREPTLPLAYRAGCNLLLCFGTDKPVEFGEEAVKWYQIMYDEVRDEPEDGPKHKALLELAQDALEDAKRRLAEEPDAEETDTDETDIDETGPKEVQETQMAEDVEEGEGGHIAEEELPEFDSQETARPARDQQLLTSSPGASTVVASSQVVPAGESLQKDSKETESSSSAEE